jgi:hypothetical protein
VRVQTAVCQVCHDPSFIDTRARAEEQARTLGKIAELQAEAGDKDFSRLIAAAKKLERASSRAEALASIAQAQTRVGDVEDAAVHILDAR